MLQALSVSVSLALYSLQGGTVGSVSVFVLVAGQCKISFVVACVFQLVFVHLR